MTGAGAPPAPTDSGTGWYVYGVVPADELGDGALADAHGVNSTESVSLVSEGRLAAIVSSVPLEQFGEGAIEQNLHDEAWLEEKVRGHEDVLEAALPHTALVPFRFGTIYRSEEQVRTMLRENADLIRALDRVRGAVELGVKAFLDVERFEQNRSGDVDEPAEGGRAYLLRKQRDRHVADERAAFGAACAQASHERLSEAAAEGRANPPQPPRVSGDAGAMILNGAYLVPAEGQEAFRGAVEGLASTYAAEGVRYEVTGPWPPYNFVVPEAAGD